MINNVSFAGTQQKLTQNIVDVVKASSILETGKKMNFEGVSSSVSKFLNISFSPETTKNFGILEGLDIDPLRSYQVSHGLDVII